MRTRSTYMVVVAAVVFTALAVLGTTTLVSDDGAGRSKLGVLDDGPGKGARRAKLTEARKAAVTRKEKGEGTKSAAAALLDHSTSSTLAGLVVNEEAQPVEGARITIRNSSGSFSRTVNTGKDGKFDAPQVPTGTYDVLATHDKYVTLIRPNYTIAPSDRKVHLDFRLPLGAMVQGDIVDEEGKPVEKVRVAARRSKLEQMTHGADIYQDDSLYRTQITDKAGTFTLAGVSLGPNLFEFARPGYEAEVRKMDISADTAGERLKVTLKKTGQIAGRVLDEKGAPVSTATIHLTRYKPFQGREEKLEKGKITVTTDATGAFEFKKLYNEGYYDLLVEEERFAPGIFPLVAVGSRAVACSLEIGGIIEGTAQFIDRPTTPAVLLIAAETVVKGTTFTAETKSDGAGRFAFGKLPYGSYKLTVDSPGYMAEPKEGVACVKDAPTKDVAMEVFEVAILRGRVADGADDRPVANATVTVKAAYGLGQSRNRSFQTKTDSHGGFEFRQLPAGLHTALATARGYMRTLTDRSEQKFTLTPGERKSDLALHLDHGGSVEGFVLDTNGRPVANGDVQLFAASEANGRVDSTAMKGRTDVTGYFRIWGLEVGERLQLYASVRKKGYSKTRSELLDLTRDAPNVSTQVVLTPGGSISGKVLDSANKLPVPGAEVKFTSSAFPGDPSPSHLIVYSTADGSYQVNNCPNGDGSVTVSRSGYVKQGRGVSVKEARVADRVDFTLETGYKIAGRVEDLFGNPIASAKVSAHGLAGAAGSDEDVTDKGGEFELSNLGRGEFRLAAAFKLKTPEGEQNYQFVKTRVAINTREATIECDVGNALAGRVENEKGVGLKRFLVKLRSRDGLKPAQEFTFHLDRPLNDAYGYFRVLKVPRGLYSMDVTADGYEPHNVEEIAVGPHRSTDFPTIRMQPAGGVYGVILSSSTSRPVNGATIRLLDVLLKDSEANAKASAGTTDYSGQFRIASVPPGTYRALVSHPSYLGLKVEDVTVTRRKQTSLGQLHLEAGGAVRGTVTDDQGNPMPNMQISVSGLAPGKATSTDQAGNFLLQGVQSGRWPIVARGHLNNRKVYAFQTVDVQRDSTERANFQLNTAADLDGILASASENPIKSGAAVRLHPFDENQSVLEDVQYDATSRNHEFSISQVPAGHYFLWAAGYGAVSSFTVWQDLFLNRGKNQAVVKVPEGRLSGTVMDETGKPLVGVGAQLYPLLGNLRLPRGLYNRLVQQQVTREDGAFVFDYLQPGAYQFLHQGSTGAWYALNPLGLANGQKISEYHVISPR